MDEMEAISEIPPLDRFALLTARDGELVGIEFHFLDPAQTPSARIVLAWLPIEWAASLSSQLATLCRQFGVEPPISRQTKQ